MNLIHKSPVRMAMMAAMIAAIFGVSLQNASAGDIRRTAGILIGATAGGLLGSAIGRGDGQVVATTVGVLIGAGVGYELTKEYPDRRIQRPRRVVRYDKVYRDSYPRKKWHRKKRTHRRHQSRDVWVCKGHSHRCRLVL